MGEGTAVKGVTDQTFKQEILDAGKPALVDFWAPWCGPCKALAPSVEELASEYQDRMTFAKVNVDENTQMASTYNVRSIPTLILFKEGKVLDTLVGLVAKDRLREWLQKAL